jgi:octaheme c-type cytochrome (tetrathionate reductase family)
MKSLLAALLVGAGVLMSGMAMGAQDHSTLIQGPFRNGPEVTKACLQCHEKQASDFMKTVHWTWSSRQKIGGKDVDLGKINAVNNFCIALPSNEPRCTSCHAGYGWKDASFDFSKPENVDCLVCHDTTGTYKKLPAGAGHPAYKDLELPPKSGKVWPAVDLLKVARSVGKTSRETCGACHFFGGGGDHVKHGDLDSSLVKPTRAMDVHMGGANMTCTSCHRAEKHVIPGKALSVSVSGSGLTLNCTDCHAGTPHKNNPRLDMHVDRIACQTCHVPTFARTLPTKVWWDWSTAGKDQMVVKDRYGLPTYDKMKGDFRWAKDVVPVYIWFNGSSERVLMGEKVDASKIVHLNNPNGSRADRASKITPFKLMRGKQPYDSSTGQIAVPHLFGPGGYWQTYDWSTAIGNGMKLAGLNYSGNFGWVETDMYWKVNHMVVPKAQALRCDDCHQARGRMDWKALGYGSDPRYKR